jgi:hypothetical protein
MDLFSEYVLERLIARSRHLRSPYQRHAGNDIHDEADRRLPNSFERRRIIDADA